MAHEKILLFGRKREVGVQNVLHGTKAMIAMGLKGVNIGLTYILVDFEGSVQSQLADGRKGKRRTEKGEGKLWRLIA